MLKPTWERFCVNYVATGKGKDSYLKAIGGRKISATGACRQAERLLRKKQVQQRIKELQDKTGIVAENELDKIKKAYGKTIKSQIQLLEYWSKLMVEGENENIRLKASELLAKYQRMFGDANIEVNNNTFAPVQVIVECVGNKKSEENINDK